jgi:hypothetical protein
VAVLPTTVGKPGLHRVHSIKFNLSFLNFEDKNFDLLVIFIILFHLYCWLLLLVNSTLI